MYWGVAREMVITYWTNNQPEKAVKASHVNFQKNK